MAAHKINPKSIIITGASSGIGQALAQHYAQAGVTLGLTGRDAERVEKVAAFCRQKGAQVDAVVLDVTNRDEMHKWLIAFDDCHQVDLVIANAGISAGTGGVLVGEPADQVRHVFGVNLNGVLNTIEPLQERMVRRGAGQIAIISSLAGFRGWPGAPAYCGSKAAVKVYGEALRGALAKTGVGVSVVCPGFVKTRMTAKNDFKMPLMIDGHKAANIIAKGLKKDKGRIVFPFISGCMAWFIAILPDFMAQYILSSTPSKQKE